MVASIVVYLSPKGVDIDTANAQFREGVLEVSFTVRERKDRKIRKLEIAGASVTTKAKAAGR